MASIEPSTKGYLSCVDIFENIDFHFKISLLDLTKTNIDTLYCYDYSNNLLIDLRAPKKFITPFKDDKVFNE